MITLLILIAINCMISFILLPWIKLRDLIRSEGSRKGRSVFELSLNEIIYVLNYFSIRTLKENVKVKGRLLQLNILASFISIHFLIWMLSLKD